MIKKIVLPVILVPLLVFSLIGLERWYHSYTRGFMEFRVMSQTPPQIQWAVTPLSANEQEKVDHIFNQPFFYLDKGGQCFVFLSQDGEYVLKLVKQYRIWSRDWLQWIPMPFCNHWKQKQIDNPKRRRLVLLESYKIAYEELRQENGLVFVHLNQGDGWHKTVEVIDAMKKHHKIDLANTVCLLQKKAELLGERIERQVKDHQMEAAKQTLDSFFEFLLMRCQRGIKDEEFNRKVWVNYGFVDDQPISVDAGRYKLDETLKYKEYALNEIELICLHFRSWLEELYPELSTHYEQRIQEFKGQAQLQINWEG